MLLVDAGRAALVVDGRYAEQAEAEVADPVEVVVTGEGLSGEAGARAGDWGLDGVGVESLHTTLRDLERLREEGEGIRWTGVGGWIEEERSRKGAEEIDAIERSARLAEEVLEAFLPEVEPGASERELAARLDFLLRSAGSEGTAFDTIVASGPRSALPHARPSERAVEAGDLILVDFGAVVDGYCSDITRTMTVGRARAWQVELHQAVLAAQEAALDAVAAGAECGAVDRAARDVLEAEGYGDAFLHSTGHGLGLEVHEEPRLHRSSETRLSPGHVVTVEPGAYLRGRGGVRIEDDVALESGGPRRLTGFSRELTEL